jgi:hypothetical protein
MLAMLWLAGCHIISPAANGESCDSNSECESESCEGNLCSGGSCTEIGASCGDGFECVHHDGGFLGSSYNRCEMLCAETGPACPDWYACVDDRHCDYTGLAITYSPAEPKANEPVTFTGQFFVDKPRRAHDWLFETSSGIGQAEGDTATYTFQNPGVVTAVFTAAYADESTAMQTQLDLTIH